MNEHMDTDKMWITMGPQHPFSHGLWTLRVKADGEIITVTSGDCSVKPAK